MTLITPSSPYYGQLINWLLMLVGAACGGMITLWKFNAGSELT